MKGNINPEPESQLFPVKSSRMAKRQRRRGDDWTAQRWLRGLLSRICLKWSLFFASVMWDFWWRPCLIMAAASSPCVGSSAPASMGREPSEQLGLSAAAASPSSLHLVFEHLAGRRRVHLVLSLFAASPSLPCSPLFFWCFHSTALSSSYPVSLTALSSSCCPPTRPPPPS